MVFNFQAENTDAGLNFDIDLEKDKRVYCFIGENGVGKTNLLENMAKSLLYSHSMFKKTSSSSSLKFKSFFYNKFVSDKIKDFSVSLPLDIKVNDLVIKNRNNTDWAIAVFEHINNVNNSNFIIDKPLIFIGAKSRGYTKNIDVDNIKILGSNEQTFVENFIRTFNYMSGEESQDIAVANWFNSRVIINPNFVPNNENRLNEVIEVFKLMDMLEEGLNLWNEEKKILDTTFYDGKLYINNIPIDKLSTGFISIIKIFQSIIAGYGAWAGVIEEKNIREMEGVVFIDEIESHLHLKWQYKIIPLLKEFFPNTTFYIATHSPLIIQTTEEGEAYELVKGAENEKNISAKKLGNPKEWYLADILSQAFHIDFTQKNRQKSSEEFDLISALKEFSIKVKDYLKDKDESLKDEIEELYNKILPSLGEDDPRRRSLDSLKSLVV